jgi:hypothetical protein
VKIYIPGRGSVDSDVYKVDRAVNQYNDRLSFEFNEAGQDYCIFMRMPYPERPVIILGFGEKVPHPDEACKRLWESDTMIHGDKSLMIFLRVRKILRMLSVMRLIRLVVILLSVLKSFCVVRGIALLLKYFLMIRRG